METQKQQPKKQNTRPSPRVFVAVLEFASHHKAMRLANLQASSVPNISIFE